MHIQISREWMFFVLYFRISSNHTLNLLTLTQSYFFATDLHPTTKEIYIQFKPIARILLTNECYCSYRTLINREYFSFFLSSLLLILCHPIIDYTSDTHIWKTNSQKWPSKILRSNSNDNIEYECNHHLNWLITICSVGIEFETILSYLTR